MELINILGQRGLYRFKDAQGNVVEEISTVEDYNDRFVDVSEAKRPVAPTKEGYRFTAGARVFYYDTADGFMHAGQYAVHADGRVEIMLQEGISKFYLPEEVAAIKSLP